MPPCCWPATSSGLRTRPQSSTATWRRSSTTPGLGVDLDHRDVGAEGVGRLALVEVELGPQALARSRPGARAAVAPRPSRAPPTTARSRARRPTPRPPAVVHDDVGDVRLEQVRGETLGLVDARPRSSCRCALPPICSEREPIVPPPAGHERGVGLHDASPASIGTPSSSATIILNAVSWPWPCGDVPTVAVTVPSVCTSTAPYSWNSPPAVTSTYAARRCRAASRRRARAAAPARAAARRTPRRDRPRRAPWRTPPSRSWRR